MAEVTRMEDDRYKIKAVSQGRQGSWTTWEGVVTQDISWSDLWKIPQARLSFLIRSTYDTLPCPRNLHQWFGIKECCSLCNAEKTKYWLEGYHLPSGGRMPRVFGVVNHTLLEGCRSDRTEDKEGN